MQLKSMLMEKKWFETRIHLDKYLVDWMGAHPILVVQFILLNKLDKIYIYRDTNYENGSSLLNFRRFSGSQKPKRQSILIVVK